MFPLSSCSLSPTAAISSRFPARDSDNSRDMEIDTLLEALKDFDKKGKKEVCSVLDQFLCHIAKTGETLVSWSQFKSYFIFKLEKVMEDFRASAPEQRGPANPNVESIPYEEMKDRIIKIVDGFSGIPFTIQRLCELLTEPKRNYTGTEKFLRGLEKNVMVVSCIYPASEKNGCSGVNRMNGVMLSGNTTAFTERKVNGPGTPRPLNRQKPSVSSSPATNGLPDSTENNDPNSSQEHSKTSSDASSSSGIGVTLGSSLKNKHLDDGEEEGMESEAHEVKRLKFNQDGEEEIEDEDEHVEVHRSTPSESSSDKSEDANSPSSMSQEVNEEDEGKRAASNRGSEDQEPSSTQSESTAADSREAFAEREVPCGSDSSSEDPSEMDQSEQRAPAGVASSPEVRDGEEPSEQVSSSSSTDENASGPSSSSSSVDSPTEGDSGSGAQDSESAEEPMEQD
ncbi:Serine/threonine-protein phosphatase 4 regulatory subunit 2-B [Triplophysa tibetana]|uniref:Serine/threonine-protein phosphatase 4 regulatory subunit 2-B n=1 Tax=Triplophysa tibetana TaxID=1572043 RepID=A0A5A9NUI9_9TELE|nr:Serine/threonine-protein phosphatase 4 regulatory subunit 2-B [Triplophysa tibetana]